tara:strand:- start:140 stop:844 length:705 start_codon:yes stop_codon:yes gene_type:complete
VFERSQTRGDAMRISVANKKAVFFGSMGVLVETSDLQRQAYNLAFEWAGINLSWNVGTYCHLLKRSGGLRRLRKCLGHKIPEERLIEIHKRKERVFSEMLSSSLRPRPGVKELIDWCKTDGKKIGWITATSEANLSAIGSAIRPHVDINDFDIITSSADAKRPKPCADVYEFALKQTNSDAPDVLAIEDTQVCLKSAISANIETLFFPNEFSHCKPKLADYVIHDLRKGIIELS